MNKRMYKKLGMVSFLCIALSGFALQAPATSFGAQYPLVIDFSPNMINIESGRIGEIRVLTNMQYSFYIANGGSPFIYFNECDNSVENITATRDSLGNLIMKFNLEDLLKVKDFLIVDAFNKVKVVVTITNGDEYIHDDPNGQEVYITTKKAD